MREENWLSKFLEASLRFLPRWGRVRTMGIVRAGMTKPNAVPGGGFHPKDVDEYASSREKTS